MVKEPVSFTWQNESIRVWFLLAADEESTIEEQEIVEGEADHKAELVDLAKEGESFRNVVGGFTGMCTNIT